MLSFCHCPHNRIPSPSTPSNRLTPRRPRSRRPLLYAQTPKSSSAPEAALKPTDLHASTLTTLYPTLPTWLISRLQTLGFTHPTQIQKATLDLALPHDDRLGSDVVIHAQTGSGKTLAYLLPAIMAVDPARSCVQALVLVPTQELGMQVYKVCRRIVSAFAWEPAAHDSDEEDVQADAVFPVLPMLDQANLRRQKLQLRQLAPRIIIGNAERVMELVQSRRLRLDLLKVLVVDEFDACLLDTRTTEALQYILGVKNREMQRQTILASATVPQHRHFLRQCTRQKWTRADIAHVWVKEQKTGGDVPDGIRHQYVRCRDGKKLAALRMLLQRFMEEGLVQGRDMRAIVFVMPSRNVRDIATALNTSLDITSPTTAATPRELVVGLDDELSIFERRRALTQFRDGQACVLIATDVAARGLDIGGVTHVLQVDTPTDADAYLHRAGRTGRRGESGVSVLLVCAGEQFVVERTGNSLGVAFERIGKEGR